MFGLFKRRPQIADTKAAPLLNFVSKFDKEGTLNIIEKQRNSNHLLEQIFCCMMLSCCEHLCSRKNTALIKSLPEADRDVLTFEALAFSSALLWSQFSPAQDADDDLEDDDTPFNDACVTGINLAGSMAYEQAGWQETELFQNRVISYTGASDVRAATERFVGICCSLRKQYAIPQARYGDGRTILGLEAANVLGIVAPFATHMPRGFAESTRRFINHFGI